MQADNEGFLYPKIKEADCIDCGLCEKVCHELHPFEERKPQKVYAAINKDEEVRLKSSSGGIFHILAQKTISEERNQNLCATREARMYTQPMLEIYADDVKCAHGSTVGQLNDAALFYMRQRGISLNEAKLLLQFAFINEVIDNMRLEPLRDRLHYLVEKRFRGELSRCEGCKLCK